MKAKQTHFPLCSILTLLVILTFSASCLLTAFNIPLHITESGSPSVASSIMDAGRKAISAWLYEKADLYFHMGKPRSRQLAFENSIFQKLLQQINPTEHIHRSGESTKEVVPWLWLAARADPHNINHYLVAAFWLAHEAGEPGIARALLAEARWNNPFSYPVAMEDAIIALKHGKPDEAANLLDAGLAFWDKNADKKTEDARLDRSRMLLYRALLFEAEGNRRKAVDRLKEILNLFPQRKEIEKRIAELESGTQPSLLASRLWTGILHSEIEERKAHEGCEYDNHEHGHEAGHDDTKQDGGGNAAYNHLHH